MEFLREIAVLDEARGKATIVCSPRRSHKWTHPAAGAFPVERAIGSRARASARGVNASRTWARLRCEAPVSPAQSKSQSGPFPWGQTASVYSVSHSVQTYGGTDQQQQPAAWLGHGNVYVHNERIEPGLIDQQHVMLDANSPLLRKIHRRLSHHRKMVGTAIVN
jgi:hypothetical protein